MLWELQIKLMLKPTILTFKAYKNIVKAEGQEKLEAMDPSTQKRQLLRTGLLGRKNWDMFLCRPKFYKSKTKNSENSGR